VFFRADKATELAHYFLWRRGTGLALSRFDLLKLMYGAERLSLRDRVAPITGDVFVNMEAGPVMSHTYDEMKNVWSAGMEPRIAAVGDKKVLYKPNRKFEAACLTELELGYAKEAWEKYSHALKLPLPEKKKFFHNEFPEWVDPTPRKQTTLELKSVFRKGFDDPPELAEEREELIQSAASFQQRFAPRHATSR
jgi:hypothetical protein